MPQVYSSILFFLIILAGPLYLFPVGSGCFSCCRHWCNLMLVVDESNGVAVAFLVWLVIVTLIVVSLWFGVSGMFETMCLWIWSDSYWFNFYRVGNYVLSLLSWFLGDCASCRSLRSAVTAYSFLLPKQGQLLRCSRTQMDASLISFVSCFNLEGCEVHDACWDRAAGAHVFPLQEPPTFGVMVGTWSNQRRWETAESRGESCDSSLCSASHRHSWLCRAERRLIEKLS